MSAYGNVGTSLGIPGKVYSLSGDMGVTGKLVIIFVMLLGKMRGLPAHTDEVIDFKFAALQHVRNKYVFSKSFSTQN